MADRRLILADRPWLFALLLAALFARALVPAGWMPTGAGLVLCDGMGPATIERHVDGGKHHHRHGPDAPATGDHPCAFASPAAAIEPPVLAAPLPSGSAPLAAYRPGVAVAVGRGLAAPPPPATGPPFA